LAIPKIMRLVEYLLRSINEFLKKKL